MSAPHDDPFGEARAQLLQGLAVVATVGEAGSRWAAVGIQQRATRAEQAERAVRQTTEQADRLDRRTRPRADPVEDALALLMTSGLDGVLVEDLLIEKG